jgi:hypothetical protein
MFGHARNQLVHLAPGAEDTRQQMAICYASSSDKYTLLLEIRKTSGSCVEPSAQSFWAEGSDKSTDCQNDLPHRAISFAAMMEICQLALLAGLSDFVPFKHGRKI